MKPEERARQNIDELLMQAGWGVQDFQRFNLSASVGVAIREFSVMSGATDYLLFVNREAVGVIEAKKEGETLTGVEEQSMKYRTGLPHDLPAARLPLPFSYESTGIEMRFTSMLDPEPRSRQVFAFHRPETLAAWLEQAPEDVPNEQNAILRSRLRRIPPLPPAGLRDCQFEAITNLERSFAENRPRALIQMATGSGKTYTAVSSIYRLVKFGGAKRVLFLVDRSNLAKQTLNEFQQFITPDDGRKFTELYNVQHLQGNSIDAVAKVCITTIQRLYSVLSGEAEPDPTEEERSLFELEAESDNQPPKEVRYNPAVPIETFDIIITDECHRSIYNKWRGVLDYFDAFIVGLTATPNKQTFGFFNKNLVMEYGHERAVADGVNVDYQVYRIRTAITEQGSTIESGFVVGKRNRQTRAKRWAQLDGELSYGANQLDRDVQLAAAQEATGQVYLDVEDRAVKATARRLFMEAVAPFDNPDLREALVQAQQRDEQIIDEITALQIFYSRPQHAPLRYADIKQLAEAIAAPPLGLSTDLLWQAYETLDRSRVREDKGKKNTKRLLTDLVSLVRYTLEYDKDESAVLEPYSETVQRRFASWLEEQEQRRGKPFTAEQRRWLELIRDNVASSLTIEQDDLEEVPFLQYGGLGKAYQLFGAELQEILQQLNERLAA